MSFEFIRKLPTPAEIKEQYPVPADIARDESKKRSGDSRCIYRKI